MKFSDTTSSQTKMGYPRCIAPETLSQTIVVLKLMAKMKNQNQKVDIHNKADGNDEYACSEKKIK